MERIEIGSPIIGVIGPGTSRPDLAKLAEEVGREVARKGAVLVCGGLGGVMTEAARGAKEIGGVTLGILPGPKTADANEFIDFPIATNMGQARNCDHRPHGGCPDSDWGRVRDPIRNSARAKDRKRRSGASAAVSGPGGDNCPDAAGGR